MSLDDDYARWRACLSSSRQDSLARCIADATGPGSLAKLAVALAALDGGCITPETRIECEGYRCYGATTIACHCATGHGSLNLYEALRCSCNVYFLEVAARMGPQPLIEVMRAMGLGKLPGEDLPGPDGLGSILDSHCVRGAVYSPELKRQAYPASDRPWRPIDTGFLAIGQADMRMTALQAAVYVNCIATGCRVRPRITMDEPYVAKDISFSLSAREAVMQGMRQVVHHPRGTGRLARVPDVILASKTGTFQRTGGPAGTKDVWIGAVYPGDAPSARIVIAIMAHDMTSGGHDLGPRLSVLVTNIREWESWNEKHRHSWPSDVSDGVVVQTTPP